LIPESPPATPLIGPATSIASIGDLNRYCYCCCITVVGFNTSQMVYCTV
jgi:hypothetical protein